MVTRGADFIMPEGPGARLDSEPGVRRADAYGGRDDVGAAGRAATVRRVTAEETIHGPRESPAEKNLMVRNILVAAVTLPFAFLIVLIMSVFVFGDGDRSRDVGARGPVAATTLKIDVADVADAAAPTAAAIAERAPSDLKALTSAGPQGDAPLSPFGPAVNGKVRSVGLDGDKLALLVDTREGARVVVYHVAQDRIVARIPVAETSGGATPAVATVATTPRPRVSTTDRSARTEVETSNAPLGRNFEVTSPSLKVSRAGPAASVAPADELNDL